MGEVAIVVEYEVKPKYREAFETLIREHVKGTLAEEPGCVRFDMMIPREDARRIFLCEVYRDEDAYQEHRLSPRLPVLREAYGPMIEHPHRVIPCDVAPRADRV